MCVRDTGDDGKGGKGNDSKSKGKGSSNDRTLRRERKTYGRGGSKGKGSEANDPTFRTICVDPLDLDNLFDEESVVNCGCCSSELESGPAPDFCDLLNDPDPPEPVCLGEETSCSVLGLRDGRTRLLQNDRDLKQNRKRRERNKKRNKKRKGGSSTSEAMVEEETPDDTNVFLKKEGKGRNRRDPRRRRKGGNSGPTKGRRKRAKKRQGKGKGAAEEDDENIVICLFPVGSDAGENVCVDPMTDLSGVVYTCGPCSI